MATLQSKIESIIKQNINEMANHQKQRKSLHIALPYNELLDELYGNDPDPTVFINHFGHIEYHNSAFSKMMMLDKYKNVLNNIYNMDQLPISFEMTDKTLHVTYPNDLTVYMTFRHQLVAIQKSSLLQMTFKNISGIFEANKTLEQYKVTAEHYLSHLKSPMFILDKDGLILNVPSADLKLFGQPCSQLLKESIFEALPFDYANEVMEKIKKITRKTDGHFMYQTEKNKIVNVYDTTVHMLTDQLYLCHINDVSDLNTMSSTIEYLNSYDSLTGFYNSNYYENYLTSLKDSSHLPLGVYTLNLSGLKKVNQEMGYHQCDNLLIEVALNIKSIISQHEIPCRITGDTFMIFFPNASKNTMDKFAGKMTDYIHHYKEAYKAYHLTYSEKNILISENSTLLSSLLKGMMH